MTAAVPFPLPPGRILSTWRRELAAFRPGRLRLVHLLLHRVEALVRTARPRPLDPLHAALLGQLSVGTPLDRLRVDGEVLRRWLGDLSADGLIESAGAGWRLTERGRRALDAGAYTATVEERRAFTFTEEDDPNSPSRYVDLHGPAVALPSPLEWRFDAAVLAECVQRPPEWKERHGFPMDVEAIAAPSGSGVGPADWRRVMLDRPEQILLVFVPAGDEPPRWLGFAVRPDGWALQTSAPALVLHEEPAAEPSPEAWREAWRSWCQGRGLPIDDADACRVEPLEDGVRVAAPRRLAGRLGVERNEAWLLAGAGRVRVAAPMEIVEEERGEPGA